MRTNPEQRLALVTDLYQLHYECICSFTYCLYHSYLIVLVVVLDKKNEVLYMMLKHGIIDVLCEIFSTSKDEDVIV